MGFLSLRPRARDWLRFAGGVVVVTAYFIAIIAATGQQFLPLLKRAFGIS